VTTLIDVGGIGKPVGWALFVLMLALAPIGAALAQGTPATGSVTPLVAKKAGIEALKGTWVRPDGGYTIAITNIGPNGELEATYFNPGRLPFAKAQATREGATVQAFFELRAGGYDGSTYELTYDPASDRLKGIYYQAVVKQSFDVYFVRK
jgi:uncharacterized protein (DUF2147 family)